jgi:hypothetical protein
MVYYIINLQGKVKILTGGKAREPLIGGRSGEIPEPMDKVQMEEDD